MAIKLSMDILASAGSVFTTLKGIGSSIEGLSKKGASDFDKLAAAGKGIAIALGGTAIALGATTVKMAADFQTGMTSLQTGAGESSSNMKLVGDGILSMAGQVGESTKSLTDGMYHIESAGYHGKAGLDVLKVAAMGAKVGSADLDTMGKTLTGTMNSYGMSASGAASMMNQLIATTASGDMKMQDLAASLGNVAPVAAAAHVKFAEVGGAIATMTAQNMSAQQATQDLAFLIRGLQNPSSVAIKEMNAMGLSSNQVAQDLGKKGLQGTLDELTTAITKHMGPSGEVLQNAFNSSKTAMADANAMMERLPKSIQGVAKQLLDGTITQKQWTAAIKGMSVEGANQAKQFATTVKAATGFNDLLREGGPAAQTYTAALSDMTGGATGLNAALMLTGTTNGPVFAQNVKNIADAANKAGGQITGWDVVQKSFNQKLAEARGHAEALGIKIGTALIPKVEAATSAAMAIVTWFGKHKAIAEALAIVIGGALTVAVGAYFVKLAKGLAENVTNFAKFLTSTGKSLLDAGQKVGSFALDVGGHLLDAGKFMWDFAASSAKALWSFGVKLATTAATAIADFVSSLASMAAAAAEAFLSMAAEAATWAVSMAAAAFEAMLPFLPIIAAVAAIGAAIYLLYRYWDQIWGFIKDVAKMAWQFLWNYVFHPIVEAGIWYIKTEIKVLLDIWNAIWGGIRDGAKAAWDFLRDDIFMPIVKIGIDGVRDGINALKTGWDTAWGAIKTIVKTAWDFLRNDVLGPIVKLGLDPIRTGLDLLKTAWHTIWSGIQSAVQTTWSVIKPIFNMISDAVGGISSAIGGMESAASSVGNFASSAVGSVGSFLGFDDGGPVPGPKGAPMLAVVHGGEYVLSNDMLDGRVGVGGGGGVTAGGAPVVQIFTQGSVLTQQDFIDQVQEAFLQQGGRFSSTWTPFAR